MDDRLKKPKDQKRRPQFSQKYVIIDGAYRQYPDGREVCLQNPKGRREYYDRTMAMAARQKWLCPCCGLAMVASVSDFRRATFDHQDGRGMNGSHRDDRILKDGTPYNFASHSWCNSDRGSKRAE